MQADGGCKDITLGACKWKIHPFHANFKGSLYECRKTCKKWNWPLYISQHYYDGAYDVCRFFSYYQSQKYCKYFDNEIRNHDASCEIIGGPPSPDLEECEKCSVSVIFRYS